MRSFLGIGKMHLSRLYSGTWDGYKCQQLLASYSGYDEILAHNRLNNQIYRHACSLAKKGHKNRASSVG